MSMEEQPIQELSTESKLLSMATLITDRAIDITEKLGHSKLENLPEDVDVVKLFVSIKLKSEKAVKMLRKAGYK